MNLGSYGRVLLDPCSVLWKVLQGQLRMAPGPLICVSFVWPFSKKKPHVQAGFNS